MLVGYLRRHIEGVDENMDCREGVAGGPVLVQAKMIR